MSRPKSEVSRLPVALPPDWDPTGTLIPDDQYEVAFAGERRIAYFSRELWLVALQVIVGPHAGSLLPHWLPIPKNRLSRTHALATAFTAATGLRPPRNAAKLRPYRFLADAAFVVQTRTVTRDVNGVERPREASYSRVHFFLKRTAGSPPMLSESSCSSES